jgi:O-Antigen ligase
MNTIQQTVTSMPAAGTRDSLRGAFFWLSAFYVVYCARPEDWIPGLHYIPLAKITGFCAFIGLVMSLGKTKRNMKDLPREAGYLLAIIGLLYVGALFSPIWKGGALFHSIDFSKIFVAWVLTFLLVTDFWKLKRIIFIQAASVAGISVISMIKGHSQARLEGVLGGIYSNPNDLAFAIVLSIPFCLAFLLSSKGILPKLAWTMGILCMLVALFFTVSRGGFVTLVVAGAVSLWHFGVRGKRFYLIFLTAVLGSALMVLAGGPLMQRFQAISGDVNSQQENKAYESYEQRKYVIERSLEGIEHYPILGLGMRNFDVYSGEWLDVHMTYLQICVEGGIPVLILYLLFINSGFRNLKQLRKRAKKKKDLDSETILFAAALHSSLVGFIVGALFAPEAYQFFPYFAVAYTACLAAIVKETLGDGQPAKNGLVRAGVNAFPREEVTHPVSSWR